MVNRASKPLATVACLGASQSVLIKWMASFQETFFWMSYSSLKFKESRLGELHRGDIKTIEDHRKQKCVLYREVIVSYVRTCAQWW